MGSNARKVGPVYLAEFCESQTSDPYSGPTSIDSIAGMKGRLPGLRKQLNSDPLYFKKVYMHTFDLAKAPGSRTLGLDSGESPTCFTLSSPGGLTRLSGRPVDALHPSRTIIPPLRTFPRTRRRNQFHIHIRPTPILERRFRHLDRVSAEEGEGGEQRYVESACGFHPEYRCGL